MDQKMPAYSTCTPLPSSLATSALIVHYEVVPSFLQIYELIQLKKNLFMFTICWIEI